MYSITVWSDFAELWRYNIFAACEGFDSVGESLYVVGEESITSEEVQQGILIEPPLPPDGFHPSSVTLRLEAAQADHAQVAVYVVAHTLPYDRIVDNSPPFDLKIVIQQEDEILYHEQHKVNQWGGASINIKI